jgi:hypothetical protein
LATTTEEKNEDVEDVEDETMKSNIFGTARS